MRRLLFVPPLLLLAGCSSRPDGTTATAAQVASSDVDPSQLQPAQGHIAPGVLVYDKGGDMQARVIKVDSDRVFSDGTKGSVSVNWDDATPQRLGNVPFKWVDRWFVLK